MFSFLRARTVDSTKGSLLPAIFIYTIPIILSTIIQDLFNTIDLIVIAKMGDSIAHASVGATSSITTLIVNSFFGLSTGIKIMLSRYFGVKDEKRIKKTIDTSLITALALGVLIAAVGIIFAPALLKVTKCPEDCYNGALLYIRIYVSAAPAILIYNFGAAILRSLGDSQRPLYYIICSGILNVVLNVILCIVLPQKVAAVAIATVASQTLGAFLVVRRLCKTDGIGHVDLFGMCWDMRMFSKIIRYGIPVAISSSLFPIANLQIQAAINSYGVSAISGNTAAISIEKIPGAVSGGFGATAIAFVGQNVGAKNPQRVIKAVFNCLWISVILTGFVGLFMYLTGDFWLAIVQPDDPEAAYFAKVRMLYILCFYALTAAAGVLSGYIQAFGYTTLNTVTSLITVFGFRMIWMWFIYPIFETYHVLMMCFAVSWTLRTILYIIFFIVIAGRYKRGKYSNL